MKIDYHTEVDGRIIPHGTQCFYPSCEEDRVGATLFCAGHELYWRANFTLSSEHGVDEQRKAFFAPYWEAARVETNTVLRMAGVPAPKAAVILRKIAEAEYEFYSTQQPRDAQHLSVPIHKIRVGDNEYIEDRIGSGLVNGYRIRARLGSESAAGLATLPPQAPSDLAAEITTSFAAYETLEASALEGSGDGNEYDEQRHLGSHIHRVCSEYAAADPTTKTEPESGE